MLNRDDNTTIISRRTAMLGFTSLGVFSALLARLAYLQVYQAENYKTLSHNNRFNFNTTVPNRGSILDRNGIAVATNKQDFRLVLIPEHVGSVEATLEQISEILPLSVPTQERIRKDIGKQAKFVPVLVAEHLDWEVFSELSMKLSNLWGVIPLESSVRDYPYPESFSHIVGYVGKPGPEMLRNDPDPLLRQPTVRIGKTGIEKVRDKTLRGKSGRQKVEVNAFGRTVRTLENDHIKAKDGTDIWLTLDAELQTYAAELFREESGSAAVMDVMTGELRTLLSMPAFNNNQFVSGLSPADMRRLNSDPRRPQFNKALGGAYPPASTFKMAVMIAALENRAIHPGEKIFCTGKMKVGDREFHCWRPKGHGPMNMHDALKHSCDSYFYDLVQQFGMEKIKPVAVQLGFGRRFDIGIGGQNAGVVPDGEWTRTRLGRAFRTGDALNAVIGQGYTLATPLQLAVMTARLANGRKAVSPLLIAGDALESMPDLNLDIRHIETVRNAMRDVCHDPGGTAYKWDGIGLADIEIAGKTGTGQVRGISAAERLNGVIKNDNLPWELRDHSVFVAYAPFQNPRFAASVLVEHGGSGAGLAADICRKILARALIRDGIAPNLGTESEAN